MELLAQWGYYGLFTGAFLAATIIPFSSDILLVAILTAGANPLAALIIATAGNWLGGLTSYWMGYIGKWEWIEKWLHVKRARLEKQQQNIHRYGSFLAFFTWLPFVGDVLAIALGFYRTNFPKSAVFMLLGKFVRFLMWTLLFIYSKEWWGWSI